MINENMQNQINELVATADLHFGDKAEYMFWRKQWKKDYKLASSINRKFKNERKTVNYNKQMEKPTASEYKFLGLNPTWPTEYGVESARDKARFLLCQLMAAREIHKNEIKACAA